MDSDFEPTVPWISNPDIVKAFLKPFAELIGRFSGPEYTCVDTQVETIFLKTNVNSPHQVIFLSDIHGGTRSHSDKESLKNIFGLVKDCAENSPTPTNQIFLIGGDIVNKPFAPYDYGSSLTVLPSLLDGISECVGQGINVVAVEGNHDIENPDWHGFYKPRLQEAGLKILTPFETSGFGETIIIGLPDITQPEYQNWHRNYLPFMRTLVPADSKQLIYLFHNPDSIPYILKYCTQDIPSLLLSGHSHLTGYDRNNGRLGKALGNLALRGIPIHNQQYVNPRLFLNEGRFLSINSPGVGIHPFHLTRRNRPMIHNIHLSASV